MFSSPKKKLAADIAKTTGIEVGIVAQVLAELAKQAYSNAASGFVLPGFGKFHVVPGAERTGVNPFTKKSTVFRAPPEIEFTIDTAAKKSFLAGMAERSEAISDTRRVSTLQPVGLVPIPEDLAAAGIGRGITYKFKVGGEPDWLQAAEVPVCCGDAMLFYGQLDSLSGGDYSIGDMGRLYVFLCQSCSRSRSIMQC